MRAVWLTTNYSLDWPNKPFRNTYEINDQQEELINVLDKLKAANFNVVFLQTRLRGDVIYNSKIEPVSPYIAAVKNTWSKYDPLAFAIEECHKRGLECHAWFVTYPLGVEKKKGKGDESPTVKKNKDQVRKHAGELFLDPGDPKTNEYLLSLVKELVANYDIDGFHMDYIRYPDKVSKSYDEISYKKYGKGKSIENWRRENINQFVYSVYDTIKAMKPWVQVSSSVVGMYDKISDNNQKHWTAYNSVFQDPENWLKNGKHDFIVPMMYYVDDFFYPFVIDWLQRSHDRLIVPGLGLYQLDEKEANWTSKQITDQIQYSRDHNTGGNAFYRARYLMNNKKDVANKIINNYYNYPALIPAMTWLDSIPPLPPGQPDANTMGDYIYLNWKYTKQDNKEVFFNVYRSETPINIRDPKNLLATRLDDSALFTPYNKDEPSGYYYLVTSYDRYHNESESSESIFFVTGIEK